MKSICFFSSYFNGNIPSYVEFYLQELTKHFSEIVLITTETELPGKGTEFLAHWKIQLMTVTNEGYDFGMWHKALKKHDISSYDRVGLVNDSCILFGTLDPFFEWLDKENVDFAGFTDSYLIKHHIQSYFMILNKKAIPLVLEYFAKNGLITENDNVIKTYEIGLSQHLLSNGLQIKAMYPVPEKGQYNYALESAKELIHNGFPLIKKKILARSYVREKWWSMVVLGFDPFPSHYIKLIKNKYSLPDGLFQDISSHKRWIKKLEFNCIAIAALVYGKLQFKHK